MNCKKCKKHVYSTWQYCPNCGTKNQNIYKGLIKCQTCKRNFLPQGIKSHIRRQAEVEYFNHIFDKHYKLYIKENADRDI